MTRPTVNLASDTTTSLLRTGETCWRASTATRATLLVDGDDYFKALRSALLLARRQILIAGWDFDSRTCLPRGPHEALDGERAAPEELGAFLGYLRARRPELDIHVVRWDYHWFYSDDRELNTRARLEQYGVTFHEDDCHPVTGCVHHKVVAIDGAIAFCGGIDLTHKRWDTCAHKADDLLRRDPAGEPYIPVHDTQLCVSGPAARDLQAYLIENWPAAEPPEQLKSEAELWPRDLRVEFQHVRIGVARTLPAIGTRSSVREIETFYLAAIASVERSLYMENQYFTSTRIAHAIAQRCKSHPELEGLLVGMNKPKTQAELHTMGHGRSAFYEVLRRAQVDDRVSLVAALTDGSSINLHSKLAIFDDRALTVGSANLNRRSMGFDVECNLILEATTPEHHATIEKLRNRLLAEHMDFDADELLAALRTQGLSRLPDIADRPRRLVRVDPRSRPLEPNLGPLLAPIFDPEQPWASTSVRQSSMRSSRWIGSLLLLGLIAAAAVTGTLVDGEFAELPALEQMLSSLLRG